MCFVRHHPSIDNKTDEIGWKCSTGGREYRHIKYHVIQRCEEFLTAYFKEICWGVTAWINLVEEEWRLLGCYAGWLLQELTFRRNLAPPSTG
jgi:hypothetical protein